MPIIIDVVFVNLEFSSCDIDKSFVFYFTFLSKTIFKATPFASDIPV